MDEPILSEFSKEFKEALLDFCEAPSPEPTFVSRLERQLLERQQVLARSEQPKRKVKRLGRQFAASLVRRRWQYAVLVLLAALVVTLFAIGPQRVLAQVQRWLGYVPGIGFVNLAETWVLPSPVEITQGDVALRVEQVIAGSENTQIVISVPGLSENDLPWPNEALERPDFTAYLLLPDGSRLELTRWELDIGSGKLEYPALPAGVNRVTLIVPRLPLVPSGALPEDWEIPLTLRPASGKLNEELFPQLYSPTDARDSHHGISLRVLDVAQTSTETAIHYQVEWSHPDWEYGFGLGSMRMPELRDDLGHIYWQSPRSNGSSVAVVAIPDPDVSQATPTPSALSHADTLVFPALSISASQATLWVDALEFTVPAQGTLSLDLGGNPQLGDAWPLDIHLEIAGFPVHISGVRLREETVETGDGGTEQRIFLELDLEPLEEQGGFSLADFDLANPTQGIYGYSGRLFAGGIEQYKGQIVFAAGSIPGGKIELQVTGATLLAHGPWEATWSIPEKGPAKAAPARLYPDIARQPGRGIQPVVEEVFLSDRLTAIKFEAVGLPPEASFVQALAHNPADPDLYRRAVELYLEDNWGRRYEPGRNQAIIRPDGEETSFDPRWQFFQPLEPLVQSLTLHVPGMEIFLPGGAWFEVEVPMGVIFKPEEYMVTVVGGGGPERQETEGRWVSDSWRVDIDLEIAGYRLHFTEAKIERDQGSDPPYRLLLAGEPPARERGDPYLFSLRFAEVERPDGEVVRIDPVLQNRGLISHPFGVIGAAEPGSSKIQSWLVLDVTAANQADLLPGRYRVELSGVTAWVAGPWELSWSISGK